MGELYKIDRGEFTILLENFNDAEGNFRFHGLIVKDKPDIVFRKQMFYDKEDGEGKTSVLIGEYLYNKLKENADAQLKEYISKNISDMGIYKQTNIYKDMLGWDEDNLESSTKNRNLTVSFSDIYKGVVSCKVDYAFCAFNFLKDVFTEIGDGFLNKEMDIFYAYRLNQIMVTEQFKRGIAPKAAAEIMNINKFLKGKKSSKLILTNGNAIQIKCGYGLSASDVFCLKDNKYYMESTYYMDPKPKNITPVQNLYSIKFGKQEYRINVENMKI